MKVGASALAALSLLATPATAQQDPAEMKEWGAMYARMDAIIGPYEAKLGLPRYWDTYCLNKTNSDEAAHPKDGSTPLGITDWRAMDREQFRITLGILEQYRTAEMMLCLSDVKARLRAAEGK